MQPQYARQPPCLCGHSGYKLMLRIHLVRMQPSLGPDRSILPRHKTGLRNPGINNSDGRTSETKVSEHKSISYHGECSYRDEATARSLRFPDRPRTSLQSILQTANRTPRARVSLHIQKPTPPAKVQYYINQSHKVAECLQYKRKKL